MYRTDSELLNEYLKNHALTSEDFKSWNIIVKDNSIIVPVYSLYGVHACTIVRNLKSNLKFELQPKDGRLSCLLYGLNRTLPFIKKSGFVFVVEGFSDTLAVHKHLTKSVCSTITSSMSKVQLALLLTISHCIIVFADGDKTGNEFALKSSKLSERITGVTIRNYDPASFIAAGGNINKIFKIITRYKNQLATMELDEDGNILSAFERTIQNDVLELDH